MVLHCVCFTRFADENHHPVTVTRVQKGRAMAISPRKRLPHNPCDIYKSRDTLDPRLYTNYYSG